MSAAFGNSLDYLHIGNIDDITTWSITSIAIFAIALLFGLEMLSVMCRLIFQQYPAIPVKGKHLDKLEFVDLVYIHINKILTIIFVYHLMQVTWNTSTIKWRLNEITISNTLLSLVLFFVFYDLIYSQCHRFLHLRWVYPYIHKHHHRQKAPSRGNDDAINVHPFEYIMGEYIHLLAVYIIPCHIIAIFLFIIIGAIFATLNHTRYDFVIPFVYSVKVHDVHHRMPESNYGQYIVLWDCIFNSYRPYNSVLNVKAE